MCYLYNLNRGRLLTGTGFRIRSPGSQDMQSCPVFTTQHASESSVIDRDAIGHLAAFLDP
ncbi:uncharacterized protein METZ01_LOCUS320987 [marine metagenome]|uniref:Uncharacterized protein n=1 Tax=marine metagenome TaxID=408172 RepID=A0A382P444_9ZZZZ